MTRETDLNAVNRALSVTVQKQQRDLAEADAKVRRLRSAMTDALLELEENYFQRAYAVLNSAIQETA